MKKLKAILNFYIRNIPIFTIGTLVLIMLFITGLYYMQFVNYNRDMVPKAVRGVFDFSDPDIESDKCIPLKGKVEFYWKEFLTPEDFKENSPEPLYLKIPGNWNGKLVNGEKLGANGYATFHFKIVVGKPGSYGIKIKEFESAFNLWINGQDYGGAGEVGTSKKEMTPSWRRKDYHVCVTQDTVDVILHISNYHHRLGGASELIYFGPSETVREAKSLRSGVETFLLGILLILILYHYTLYHYRRKDKSILYFGLMCLAILFRLSTTGEKLLLELFPFISWGIAIRIEYISMPFIGMMMVAFFHKMLPGCIPNWFRKTIYAIALGLSAIILFLPASIFTYTSYIVAGLTFLLVVGLFIFLLKALIRKHNNALGIFLGFILLFLVMINDVLFYLSVIETSYLLPFGLIILLLTQAFIISRNTSLAYAQVEKLSKELEEHTEKLEETVENRTRELKEQAETLDQANQRLRELDTFKKEMTRMMVHDLKNPLGNIVGLIQLPELGRDNRELIIYSGNEMQNLIQNILDVTKFEETELKLYRGKALLYDLADAAYQQNKYNLTLNSIQFENKISRDFIIDADKELIIRVFINIISNATRHLKYEKRIRISADMIEKNKKKYYKVSVFNSGELIPEDRLEAIFDVYHQIYDKPDEFKYSSGIGLTFCKMAVEAHGGEIAAFNEEGKGVTFWFTLPV